MSPENPFIFLIDTLFSIYIAIMLLRFILQQVGADFYNPISQFVVKATQPLVSLFRRFIPSIKKVDTASLVLVFALILIKLVILFSIAGAQNCFIPAYLAMKQLRKNMGIPLRQTN